MGRQRCAGRLQWLSLCLVGGDGGGAALAAWGCGCDGRIAFDASADGLCGCAEIVDVMGI